MAELAAAACLTLSAEEVAALEAAVPAANVAGTRCLLLPPRWLRRANHLLMLGAIGLPCWPPTASTLD